MYYPKGMKARVSPVQSIEPHRILAPTRDLNREPLGPQSRVVTTILPLHTNLTFLSKLLERAVYEQIVGHMECHHLLPPLQSAYQKHRSTETATIKVMSDQARREGGQGGKCPGARRLLGARQGPQSTLSIWDMRGSYIRGPYMRGPVIALPRGPDFHSVALCLTSTEQLTQALSRCSAFSISAPLSILSTTWSFWFDFNIATASRGSCSGGSNLTWQGVRSSYVSTVKPRPQRWSLPVSLRDRCSAPILFIAYSAEVIGIVEQHGLNMHAFADDLQVYGHSAQHEAALLSTRMSTCIESIKAWMSSNRLRLNPSKTELIWLGSSRRLHHCSSTRMRVSDVDLRPVDCVRDLGVPIDSGMTLARHVNHISGVCLFQLRQLRIIRRSLTTDAAHALVCALIHTRIDYCNGLLASSPRYLTDKLQVVLRAAARMVLQLPYRNLTFS